MSDIDVVGLLEMGEDLYASVMIDTCRITRNVPRSQWVLDTVTRKLVPPPGATKYEGQCVLTAALTKGEDTLLGRVVDANTFIVDVPLALTDAEEGDILQMLTCVMDSKVVGLFLRVDGVVLESFAIARSLVCGSDVPG